MLTDQFANLEQAGQVVGERITMAEIFTDLPAELGAVTPAVIEQIDRDSSQRGFVAQILAESERRLNGSETFDRSNRLLTGVPPLGRHVLIGGPGQGKTTLTQFLCQIFRTAILDGVPPHLLDEEVREVMQDIRRWCDSTGYALPQARRFPVRITLTEFSSDLADRKVDVHTVLGHITNKIARRFAAPLTPEIFRVWLRNYPWLIVFDGLDEVPASSNRDDVLRAISDFAIDIGDANADVLIVGSTRPQGYDDDFNVNGSVTTRSCHSHPDERLPMGTKSRTCGFVAIMSEGIWYIAGLSQQLNIPPPAA